MTEELGDRLATYRRLYIERMVSHGVERALAEQTFDAGAVNFDIDPESAADDELEYWEQP